MECEKCKCNLDYLTEDMDNWSSADEKSEVYVTDHVETYHHDLGPGADFTLNVRCPDCGHITSERDGYP